MEITHERLLHLGFQPVPGRAQRYAYKGIVGRLHADTGTYVFTGLSLPVMLMADLKYMCMVIDYNEQAGLAGYPTHNN